MDKLLEGLKAKAKLDCEEAHRQLMCAINGKRCLLNYHTVFVLGNNSPIVSISLLENCHC